MSKPMHLDWVLNEWSLGRQRRVGVMRGHSLDERYDHVIEQTLQEVATAHGNGSYLFTTDPHTNADCPFREGDVLAMTVTPVEGEYKLPAVGGDDRASQ